jgi:uncharacterized protein YjiS (DUF1127 family)
VSSISVNLRIKIIRFTYTIGIHYSQYPLSIRTLTSHKLIGDAMTEYTEKCPANLAASPAGLVDSLRQTARRWLATQRLKNSLCRERAQLLAMSDAELRDIGIDRATAEHEARRSDIPAGRNR